MGRILAIDYGLKRTGLAVTDPLKIIANALTTVETKDIFNFLKTYFGKEQVETIVVGLPKNLQGEDTDITSAVRKFIIQLQKLFPEKEVKVFDERFTSKMALNTLIQAGTTKKFRKEKGNIDKVSATIILQDFLDSLN